ncbi:MAG: allophanate hydrolase [Chloroflexi bacterium]|nr:allophanate hydrolase [Chloroflexota bacterium]|tara:strand:+ start:5383 stop:6099 length:717 start_codon:yes stop_codon:yes gene_type:complete
MNTELKFLSAGNQSLVTELGNTINNEINQNIRALTYSIEKNNIDGVIELIPSYRSIMINFDPLKLCILDLKKTISELYLNLKSIDLPEPKTIEIPTLYGGKQGPDLEFVAKNSKLTVEEVISIHSNNIYPIFMIGFTPGFPYLKGLDQRLSTPRLKTPRISIPEGSVGIAENQTGIYPIKSPGGWQIIGRTPIKLFSPNKLNPFIFNIGDNLKFTILSNEKEFYEIEEKINLSKENSI